MSQNFYHFLLLQLGISVALPLALVLSPATALAGAPQQTTFQTKILAPSGAGLEATNVKFRFTILDSAGTCALYVEDYSGVNMSGSGGLATFSLGSGAKQFPSTATAMHEVFNNSATALPCQAGGTYTPAFYDRRQIIMQFNDGSGWGWQTLPQMAVNSVMYANYATRADSLGSYLAQDYLRPATLPSCTASQAITWNGTTFTCVTASGGGGGGGGGVTSLTGTAPVTVTGTTTPVVSMAQATSSANGYLSSSDWTLFNSKASSSLTNGQIYMGNSSSIATGVAVSGDATLANTGALTLAASGVTAATYGSSSAIPSITVDAKGRITSASSAAYQDATSAAKGVVKVGSNITVSSGVISLQASDVTNALGFIPAASGSGFSNGGNAFTADATLGASSNFGLGFLTNNVNRMYIANSGNVGIGTTSPGRLLQVAGPMRVTPSALPGTPAAGDIAVDSGDSNKLKVYDGSGWVAAGGSSSGVSGLTAGKIPKAASASSLADSLISESGTNVTLGVVAINTTAPSISNTQNSDFTINGQGGTSSLNFKSTGSIDLNVSTGAPFRVISGADTIFSLNSGAVNNWNFATNYGSSGDLNIIQTAGAPGRIVASQPIAANINSATTGLAVAQSGAGNAATFLGGNVGVGTTSPQAALEVSGIANAFYTSSSGAVAVPSDMAGASPSNLKISNRSGSFNKFSMLTFSAQGDAAGPQQSYIGNVAESTAPYYAGTMVFGQRTGASAYQERMRIDPAGNVGIGTTSPGAKLEVSSGVANTSGLKFTNFTSASPTGSGQPVGVDASGNLITLSSGGGGTVTGVTATAPIVSSGGNAPVISMAAATAAVDGYLKATDFTIFNDKLGTASTFSGDVTGTSSTTSVDKIKGVGLAPVAYLAGQVLRYDGTNWVNNNLSMFDLRSTVTGTATFGSGTSGCASNQTLTWVAATDNLACTNISLPIGQVTGILALANGGTGATSQAGAANAILPSQSSNTGKFLTTNGTNASWANITASQWTTSTNDIYYTTGNVGIGTITPGAALDINGNLRFTKAADRTISVEGSSGGANPGRSLGITAGAATGALATAGNLNLAAGMGGASGGSVNISAGDGTVAGGSIDLRTGTTGTVYGNITMVTAGGNVGIGTTSPTSALDVTGQVKASMAASPAISGTSTNSFGVYGMSSTLNGVYGISTSATGGSGVVGFSTGLSGYGVTGTATGSGGTAGYFSSTSGYGVVVASGNVGIGTSSPGAPLTISATTVDSGTAAVFLMQNTNAAQTGGDTYQVIKSQNGNSAYIYQRNAAGLAGFSAVNGFSIDIYGGTNSIGVFKNSGDVALGGTITSATTYAGSKMFIDGTSGNVGIGTASPEAKHDVRGVASMEASIEGASSYVNSGASYSIPDSSLNIRRLTLNANTTITLPSFTSTAVRVYSLTVFVKQDATGGRTLTWAGNGGDTIQWDAGVAPTISATAGKVTILQFTKASDETVWYGSMVWKAD